MDKTFVSDLKISSTKMPPHIYNLVFFIRDSLRHPNPITFPCRTANSQNKRFHFPLLLSKKKNGSWYQKFSSESILYNAFLKLAKSVSSKIYSVNDLAGLICKQRSE